MNLLYPLFFFSLAFLALFAIAEGLYRWAKVPVEYTRKLVHIGTGLLSLLFPVWLTEIWQVIALCASFLILLLISLRMGWLPSINAVERKTHGSWLFAVIVILVFLFYNLMRQQADIQFQPLYYFYVPLLILAFCDPIAALAGSKWKERFRIENNQKTLAGTAAFFLLAFIINLLLSLFFQKTGYSILWLLLATIAIAITTALAERYTGHGWDNFTIPAAAMLTIATIEHFV